MKHQNLGYDLYTPFKRNPIANDFAYTPVLIGVGIVLAIILIVSVFGEEGIGSVIYSVIK